ncbi:MAG: hypothetical protein HKN06_04005 [Gammaproteobacteria bacterium]|nr:hypothetical protein [Gammaproteobacteria bacterium]
MLLFLLAGLSGCPSKTGRSDIEPVAVTVNPTVTPDTFLRFDNTYTVAGTSLIDSAAYASAYFAAVDPNSERTTLAAWKAVNGFDSGADVNVTFRDTKDLGYGRDMYARVRIDGGIAIYVDNYVVQPLPGDATGYGPINLDAAINKDRRYQIGTNVIEYSPMDEADPSSDKIVKMFIFGPPEADGTQQRLLIADLDGRGKKHVPTTCFSCHGGSMYPLNSDGSFSGDTLRSAKMNILDPATFEFPAFTESQQLAGIKQINMMVYDHYLEMDQRPDIEQAKWDNSLAAELVIGAYGGDFSATNFDTSFVPEGWRQSADRPEGVELLYNEVVEPHCVNCHSLQASNSAKEYTAPVLFNDQQVNLANAVSFSSYEQFISYNDEIIDRVYRHARMPMSLLNYSKFWRNPEGPPALLASFLQGFDVLGANGRVIPPGKPVPLPGANRTVTSPVVQDASGSYLTERFAWTIVSKPNNATASLANANAAATTLTADTDGDYVLELRVSNAMGSSTARVTLTVDSAMIPAPSELTFANDIRAVLNDSSAGRSCASCHRAQSEFLGIPVYFDDSNPTLFQNVLERVNFRDPENSPLLHKPTKLQHGGGIALDRANSQDNDNYITLLNWIRNGAPCGSDPTFCSAGSLHQR